MFISGNYTIESVPSEAFDKLLGIRGKLDACEGGKMQFRLRDGRVLESRNVRLIKSISGGNYVYIVTASGNTYEFVRVN